MADLTPKCSLVATQAIKRTVIEIGEAQEAAPELGISAARRSAGATKIVLSVVMLRCLVICSTIVPFWVTANTVWIVVEPKDRVETTIVRARLSSPRLSDLTQDFALDLQ